MKYVSLVILLLAAMQTEAQPNTVTIEQQSADSLFAKLSMELLLAVRNGEDHEDITNKLARVSVEELDRSLDSEGERKAFWLNIYNAYVQIILGENPELLKTRNDFFGYNFFSSPQVTIAGHELSFDDIEHGIIRHSKVKLSLGYMNKWGWWIDDFEKRFRWAEVDPRVHFALNCGAASCPKIAIFEPSRVNEQLDISTSQYLKQSTDYDKESNMVKVSRLFSWFRADFGGLDEVPSFLKKYEVVPADADPELKFKEYDWTIDLGNYKDI